MTTTPTASCEHGDKFAGLSPQFNVGDSLGEPGAFGSVYAIEDRRTGDQYAAKILKIPEPGSMKYDVLMGLYRQEIDILGSLSHPGVVRLERVIRSQSFVYLIMERCYGGDLFDYICSRGGKLPEQEAALIFYQILQPVAYLHDVVGVVHCDIKLANIMFSEPGTAKGVMLIDFGVSSRCQAGIVLTQRSGTTAFMAPEQIKQQYGTQVDLWSLGVVLYIMLFGFSPWDPFCTADNKAIESMILRGFWKETLPGYGPWFPKSIPRSELAKDLISKLLRYNPDKRITAAEALEHPWITEYLQKEG